MIHIVKCFCANNHLLAASLWEEPNTTPEKAKRYMKLIMENSIALGIVQPGCKVCGSKIFHYEDERTNFTKFKDADAEVRRINRQNIIERQLVNRN